MKAGKITYHKANTLADAVSLAARLAGTSKYMAGGQSLLPMMNLRLAMPEAVIDISGIASLRESKTVDGKLFIGAGTTNAMLEDGNAPGPLHAYLRHVASRIAYRSIRNRGTIGGSLAHADPAGDWPAAMLALDAIAVIYGAKSVRNVPVSAFQVGLMETCLAQTDILQGVLLPQLSAGARWGYVKFSHKVGEFAHSIGAVVLDPGLGLANAVLGGSGDKPMLLPAVSSRLAAGLTLNDSSGSAFATLVEQDIAAVTGHAPASYEFHLHKTIIIRAVTEALKK